MTDVEVGQKIGVRCEVAPGPFADEFLVTIETTSGPMSGFVTEQNLIISGEDHYVRAIVENVEADQLGVLIGGSFFTTSGSAFISYDIASTL